MPKKEKPTIAYEPVQKIASNLQDSGLTYDGRLTPLSYEDAAEKIQESGDTPVEEVLREKIQRVKAGLEEKRLDTKKTHKKETAKKVAAYSEDPDKAKHEAQMRVTTLQNEYGMLRQRHEFKVHQAKEMMQSRALSVEEKEEIAKHKKEVKQLESQIAGLEEKKSKKKKVSQQEAVEKALAPLRAQLAKKGLAAEELLKKGDFAKAERELLLNIKQELYDIEDRLAHIENEIKIESTDILGVHRLANKETPRFVANIYSEHTQTTTVNKESLNDAGENISFTTRTGEQRTGTKTNKEGKEVSLAQKSEARLNFEKQLAEVGAAQAQYLEAYKNHFAGLSTGKLRQNAILESLGLRKADHARALKNERTQYEQAKASLTENLKRDLIEGRGFAVDQAERVAKKYIEKVLTIENVKQAESQVTTLRTELVDTRLADEAKKKEQNYNTAKGMKKFGLWIDRNKLKLGGKAVSATIALASGLGAGAWALRAVAGMVGGQLGTKAGKFLGEKLGKKLFNSDADSKHVENITNKYLEGKISITDYQKKLEALGLNANKVTALLMIAGGAGGALGGTALEGFGYTHLQPMVADVQKDIHEGIKGVHKLQGLTREYETSEPEPVETPAADVGQSEPTLWERMNPKRWFGNDDETFFGDKDTPTENASPVVLEDNTDSSTATEESESAASESTQGETVATSDSTKPTVQETEQVSTGNTIEVSAEKGDGYIRLVEKMQAKLEAKYPNIEDAPPGAQALLAKDATQFSIEEKMLVYTDGKASSGIVHPGYRLTFNEETGQMLVLDKDGDLVATIEDGIKGTDEVYTGAMDTPHASEATEAPESNPETPAQPETLSSSEAVVVPSGEVAERDELGNIVTTDGTDVKTTESSASENKASITGSEKQNAADVFQSAPGDNTLEVDTEGYDDSVVAMAKKYVGAFPPENQQKFLDTYTSLVNKIFAYDVEGKVLTSGFEDLSLWDSFKGKSLATFNAAYTANISEGNAVNTTAQELHNYLYVNNDYSGLSVIENPPPKLTIEDALAYIALKKI